MTATTPGKTNHFSWPAKVRGRVVDVLILGALAFAALLVHGYHPYAEDAAIYVPAIKKDLHPSLYPWGSEFFTSHGRMTLFDDIVAASIKATHLQVDVALLLWHLFCIFLLLAASLLLSEQICTKRRHRWTAVGLIGSVLTVPVAGTALLMMDPYLNPRSLSTPLALFAITAVLTRRHLLCALCLAAIAPVHPLMTVYAAALCGIILLNRMNAIQTAWGSLQAAASRLKLAVGLEWAPATACALVLPMCLFALGSHLPSTDAAYSDALSTRSYFFLKNWSWYEWLGVIAPLLLIRLFCSWRSSRAASEVSNACISLGLVATVSAVLFSTSPAFDCLAESQPMRAFHPIYVIFFILVGGVLGDFVLRRSVLRHVLLLAPVCTLMFFVQRATFPSDRHVEWPGVSSSNPWVRAFIWIREQTPSSAVFALDPDHMNASGEDHQGFRAIAERSMLADYGKDAGVVTMFPSLAREWKAEVNALQSWTLFREADFQKLSKSYGVSWVVLQKPTTAGLSCPYQNESLLVCQIQPPKT